MGRLSRIAKSVLREMNYRQPKVVEVPGISNALLLDGHLALVTGGSSGIGFEIARRFSQSGCNVIISSSNEKKVTDAVSIVNSPLDDM